MIGVLGGGQLGRMLALAGVPLGERFVFVDPSPQAPAAQVGDLIVAPYDDAQAVGRLAEVCHVVTYEFENVPASSLDLLEGTTPALPPPDALRTSQDRSTEKSLFESVGLPVAPFRSVASPDELRAAVSEVGAPVVVKTRREGYDGKGQVVLRTEDDLERGLALVSERPCLVERLIEFDRELSVIAVRSRDGEVQVYPLIENHHRDGILRLSLAPAPGLTAGLQAEAERHVRALLELLDYVGVMTVELFEVEGSLLGNEMAPRVHNSGHWSIEGAQTSQFENHIRAITGRPLGSTAARGDWAMVNLIGELPRLEELFRLPDVHVHLYDKQPRAGRKLGHVNVPAAHAEQVTDLIASD